MSDAPATVSVLLVVAESGVGEPAARSLEREDEAVAVETATGASEALDRLAEASYDCVVSAFDLPDADGIELLRSVRDDHPTLPFLLVTDQGSETVASEAISAGVTDYLEQAAGTDHAAELVQRIRIAVDRGRETQTARETEAWVSTLLEHSSDYLLVVDATGTVSYVSPSIRRVMGYDPDEIVGTSAFEFAHPDDVDRAASAFAETLEAPDEEVTVQFRAHDAEGNVRWLEVRGRNLLDDPIVEGVLVNARDVTGRRELRSQLERERDRFQAVFEQAFEGMVLADDDGRYIEANESAVELFGVPREELLGSTIKDFAPDGFDFEGAWEGFQSAERDRGTFPMVRPDGTELVVEYAATANIAPGQHLSILRDITERQARASALQQVRERMEFALEMTDSVIFELDYETGTETRHGPFERLFGIPDDVVRTPEAFYERAVHPDDRETVESRQSEVVERRTDAVEVEYRTHPDAGEVRWIRSAMAQVPDADRGDSLIGLSTDVTALKEREAELERQNERLEQFASFLSHDLRNPLSVAEGRLALAREERDSDDLAAVARAHDRMRGLIEDLLTIAREGEEAGSTEPVNLAEAAERSWCDLGAETATLRTETDRSILARPGALQQLLENLLGNAVEHGGDGVTVTVGALDDGFFVEDDGPGIPEEHRSRIFEEGFSTAEGGTGLGLSIVRTVADSHGWTVDVDAGRDGGARFEVRGVESA